MTDAQPTAFHDHDHDDCTQDVLAKVDRLASDRGLRMTPVRRRVLEILLEGHRAMGAYEVLDRLAAEGFGAQPPVAYRALEFLVEHGLAHRIRRLNAFAPCMHPEIDHAPAFFICEVCNLVAEAPGEAVRGALDAAGKAIGFRLKRANVEAVGLCPNCAEAA
ncbi:transcriptional repressor [Anianabacter salinae]|uniref:transcriptional repressor n=1 Tax=Anianabacter salinae TaxID=2851023 RepID=UPI00225DCF6D|nr:transcriptional repressor [Anianabacter salinae]MBV0910881.1 transcriptional repressor [Anianabacter salinae]